MPRAFVEEVMRRCLSGAEAGFGKRCTFHFTQTDVVLAPVRPTTPAV
jgi:hypothetical protein